MLLGFENHKAWDLEARLTQRLDQPLTGTGLSSSQYGLDLRESILDRVQIRRVGRQLQKPASRLFDELAHALALWAPGLSITTTCPTRRLGSKNCSM